MSNKPTRWRESNLLALILAAIMCLSCLLLACAVPTVLTVAAGSQSSIQSNGPMSVIPMCAWARNGTVGLWWNSSITASRVVSSSQRYNALCIAMPWTGMLPARGRPSIDIMP